jgi:murein DD-endopeptidase MepM/ murein hydrolase activator NlpD
MNARRALAMFRDTVPERRSVSFGWPRPFRGTVRMRPLMPYLAALATIVVLALLLSYAARRATGPLFAGMSDSGVALSIADVRGDADTAGPGGTARARSQGAGRRAQGAAAARTRAGASAVATAGAAVPGVALPPAIEELRRRGLSLPVNGVRADQLVPTFDEARGDRPHEAIDIMSPRGTPVVATEDGRIAKLFWSKAGGHTIYQFDPAERYVYYYAHLDRYADGLAEGQTVTRGQTIGFVGSTGNAKADAPHLHFAIFLLTPEKRWWDGAALDPYPVLRWNIDGGTP